MFYGAAQRRRPSRRLTPAVGMGTGDRDALWINVRGLLRGSSPRHPQATLPTIGHSSSRLVPDCIGNVALIQTNRSDKETHERSNDSSKSKSWRRHDALL
jgi:hypothetical protein